MKEEKLTLTIAETAKILGLSKGKTYEEAKLGRLPDLPPVVVPLLTSLP